MSGIKSESYGIDLKKIVILALLAVMVALGTIAFSGGTASAKHGVCPTGWFTQAVPAGDVFDKNGDNIVCTKRIPNDNGKGNSANRQGTLPAHADGHNHQDNH